MATDLLNKNKEQGIIELFKKEFLRTQGTLEKLNELWGDMKETMDENDESGTYEISLETARIGERLALKLRDLATCPNAIQREEAVANFIKETALVEVGFTKEGWFRLSIPALLPRKEKGNPEYIRSLIYPAMSDFFKGKIIQQFRDCTLIYLHIYDENRPKREWRDHDNIEINAVTDIVALFVMVDDNPHICEHYYASKSGKKNRTEVFVLPKRDLEKFRRIHGLYDTHK